VGTALRHRLVDVVGAAHVSTDPDVLAGRSIDWTGRYRGSASALVRPGSTDEVAAVLRSCRDAGVRVTVQGGRTSLVAGTVPEHDDVLLSTERLNGIGDVDAAARRVRVGAGVTLSQAQRAAATAGLLIGVDLTSRDSATIGGMVSTDAGGLHTVCYGSMGKQVLGLEVALPDGSVLRSCAPAGASNTGYDLTALFAGAEGTLGVITAVDLRLHPIPAHRATALCGFTDLDALVAAAGILRDVETIAALELIDGRAIALADEHLGLSAPRGDAWLLLVELAAADDPSDRLAAALAGSTPSAAAPPGATRTGRHRRLWPGRSRRTHRPRPGRGRRGRSPRVRHSGPGG
jgi:FAD/FMN-containing dehydrogenase